MKILLVFAFLLLGGCTSQSEGLFSAHDIKNFRAIAPRIVRGLGSAESIELVSLSPYPPGPPGPIAIGSLEDFPILGEAKISGRDEILKLAESLAAGIRATEGEAFMCFNPRHGIRYMAEGKPVVLLVCFECRRGQILSAGKKIEFLTTAEPESTWDGLFSKHGLSKAK